MLTDIISAVWTSLINQEIEGAFLFHSGCLVIPSSIHDVTSDTQQFFPRRMEKQSQRTDVYDATGGYDVLDYRTLDI